MTNTVQVKIEVRERRLTKGRRMSEFNGKTRVYFDHEGESILENFGNRVARPQALYETYLGDVAEALGLPRTSKIRWSQKAGCRCGCSPGFVCSDSYRKDVWVTLTNAPKTSDDPAALALAENRVGQLVGQLSAEAKVSEDITYRSQLENLIS